MKKDLHPTDYRPVVFQDSGAGFAFLTKSTAKTDKTIKWEDGNEYPLVEVHISSASHPFYTGEEKIVDVEGRVDRFKARAEASKSKKAALTAKAKKAKVKAAERTEEDQPTKLGAKPQPKAKKPNPKAEAKDKSEPANDQADPEAQAETDKPAADN